MTIPSRDLSQLLEFVVEHIDIPKSLYEKARSRHHSVGKWLCRPESLLAKFDPDVRPQGSFRYGTVTRPILEDEEYDLDNVCLLRRLSKSLLTQEQLKKRYGDEIKAYAKAHNMTSPVEECNRCWRLPYADEVPFHLDTLPCLPEQDLVKRLLEQRIASDLANRAVAITDRRHPRYRELTDDWLTSNPRGFAKWFELQAALGRERAFAEGRLKAAVEDVPPYEWKTTLQRSIQILKRHRDVMFRNKSDVAPISMIITNLAAHAYDGNPDLGAALLTIVDGMPAYVRSAAPWVPNPTHPAEDYAEKWNADPGLRKNFWDWHAAVKADLARLTLHVGRSTLKVQVSDSFLVDLGDDELRALGSYGSARPSNGVKAAPVLTIPSASKPWGHGG